MARFSIRERLGLAVVVVAILVLTVGGFFYRQRSHAAPALTIEAPSEDSGGSVEIPAHAAADRTAIDRTADRVAADKPDKENADAPPPASPPTLLIVHVAGAVKRPGVYTLHDGDRIYHAIRAAGGFKKNAAQDALNLADKLRDADQLLVPVQQHTPAVPDRMAAAAPPAPSLSGAPLAKSPKPGRVLGKSQIVLAAAMPAPAATVAEAPAPKKFHDPGDGTVHLNTATADELQQLPGVGPATAARILAYREQIGRFDDLSQLRDVRGIGEKTLAKLQPFLAL